MVGCGAGCSARWLDVEGVEGGAAGTVGLAATEATRSRAVAAAGELGAEGAAVLATFGAASCWGVAARCSPSRIKKPPICRRRTSSENPIATKSAMRRPAARPREKSPQRNGARTRCKRVLATEPAADAELGRRLNGPCRAATGAANGLEDWAIKVRICRRASEASPLNCRPPVFRCSSVQARRPTASTQLPLTESAKGSVAPRGTGATA